MPIFVADSNSCASFPHPIRTRQLRQDDRELLDSYEVRVEAAISTKRTKPSSTSSILQCP
jgi:hypothetical protein